MPAVHSTSPPDRANGSTRRAVLGASLAAWLGGCAAPDGFVPSSRSSANEAGVFVMPDEARLPFRSWLPPGQPEAAVLALHGFNDSRDAWEIPAVDLAAAGWAVYAPDQRGFGAAPERGRWPGTEPLVRDAAIMARLVRRRHPAARLVLLGESMGGAVLMCLAARAPAGLGEARYGLVAPAVWGRARMNVVLRSGLWLAASLVPGLAVSGAPVRVTATDNRAALLRLSRDPLTLHATRFGTLRGLVDLMDAALAAAADFSAPGLFMYGGHDELVPKGAMAAMWRTLPLRGARTAFYPQAYHLLLRDLHRAVAVSDLTAWVRDPLVRLPSGADGAAEAWLRRRA